MYKKQGFGNLEIRKQLAIFRNPWSGATASPKIPDLKTYDSAGLRLQSLIEMESGPSGEIWICLYGGINNGLWYIKGTDLGPGFAPFQNHASFEVKPAGFTQPQDTKISKWRLVSSGLKLSLINTTDENDGWWEAIRYQGSNAPLTSWKLIPQGTAGGTEYGVVGPESGANDSPGIDMNAQNFVEVNSYSSGKLKDLHRVLFNLKPTGGDHDFSNLDNTIGTSGIDGSLVDPNWDCIAIKIHGRKKSATVQGTRLLAHVVANQEIIYDEGASLSRFMNGTQPGSQAVFESAKRYMMTNRQAATKMRAIVKFMS